MVFTNDMNTFIENIQKEKARQFWNDTKKCQRFQTPSPSTKVDTPPEDVLAPVKEPVEKHEIFSKRVIEKYGSGPIRCQEIDTEKYYHGVVETDFKKNVPNHMHSFFQKINGGKVWNRNWDTDMPVSQYCNNCVVVKKKPKTIWYECLGH